MVTVNLNSISFRSMAPHKAKNMVAIVGVRNMVVLSCTNDDFKVVLTYQDDNKEENINTVDFLESNGESYCVIGGEKGVVKLLEVGSFKMHGYITAHNKPIINIKALGEYFITSSEDCTIKLWSMVNFQCIHMLGGNGAHTDSIVSVDINTNNKNMISCGLDLRIIEWEYRAKSLEYVPVFQAVNTYRCYLSNMIYYGNLLVCLCKSNKIIFLKLIYPTVNRSTMSNNSTGSSANTSRDRSSEDSGRRLGSNNHSLSRSSEQSFYSTSVFYNPMISVENMSFQGGNLEISENFRLIKEIGLDHSVIIKMTIENHTLFCLANYRFIFTIDLKLLFQDYDVNKLKLGHKQATIDFAITNDYVFVLFEDGTIESIEHNKQI